MPIWECIRTMSQTFPVFPEWGVELETKDQQLTISTF